MTMTMDDEDDARDDPDGMTERLTTRATA